MHTKYFIKNFIEKYGDNVIYSYKNNKKDIKAIISIINKPSYNNIEFSKLGIIHNNKYYLCCLPINDMPLEIGSTIVYNDSNFTVSHSDIVILNNSPIYAFATIYKNSQTNI